VGLIPRPIWSQLINLGPTAHIEEFRNLFEYLNTESTADDLRQLVVIYFNDVRYLQPFLHTPLSTAVKVEGKSTTPSLTLYRRREGL